MGNLKYEGQNKHAGEMFFEKYLNKINSKKIEPNSIQVGRIDIPNAISRYT